MHAEYYSIPYLGLRMILAASERVPSPASTAASIMLNGG